MKHHTVRKSSSENYLNSRKEVDIYWGRYRFFTTEELESIPLDEIQKGIGSHGNYTYNCSLRRLLNKKFGTIPNSDVVKWENLGFAIRIIDYKEKREAFMKESSGHKRWLNTKNNNEK